MARRIIATAEVQVQADVARAEEGLQDLTTTFRQIGNTAERAASRAEVAMFGAAKTMEQGFNKVVAESFKMVRGLEKGDQAAREMAVSLRQSVQVANRLGKTDLDEGATQALRVFKEIYQVTQLIDRGLHDDARAAELVADAAREAARKTQEIENEVLAAERRTHRLGEAFRDVGRDIDLAMAGGLDELKEDINRSIRRLAELGDEGHDVSRHMERSFDGILREFDNDVDEATAALFRLKRAGDSALNELDEDARSAAAALRKMEREARKADRSVDRMGRSARRVSGNVRGLVGLLGAAGLGYAAAQVTRFGLDMTQQLEKSEAAFLGLTGSVEGAADMLERMVVFARETPYNLANVTQAAAQLLAVGDGFGVTAQNVDKYLTSFGNALTITGGSEDQFVRIVRVLGQMSSTGKVLGQDMNQLAQNLPGFNVWQTLADGAGTSVQELRRLQDIGQLDELLTGDEAVRILIDGMEGIPGAAGAMERRMNTLGGAIEKFKETTQLAISEGLQPFSETAQDVLKDPVILNSVEDLSIAFGGLLSSGLEAVAPELDDIAAAAELFLVALEDWAPVFAQVVDALGDFLIGAAPIISALGQLTEGVLGFGDGLGKMAVAIPLAFGGPIGIAASVLFGVSGAMDYFAGSAETAANTARILAAVQGDVNEAMAVGEEVIYSEAQQLAIQQAEDLRENYEHLTTAMLSLGIANDGTSLTVGELNSGLASMADGTDFATDRIAYFFNQIGGLDADNTVAKDLEAYSEAWEQMGVDVEEAADDNTRMLAQAGVEDIGLLEEREEAQREHTEAIAEEWKAEGEARLAAMEKQAEVVEVMTELDEEHTDKLKELLQEQADAYEEWASDIDGSTSGAALSLSGVAEEAENDVGKMIQAIEDHTAATASWQNNIVSVGAILSSEFGATDEEAQAFMGTLGEMGDAAGPALQSMLDDFGSAESSGELESFYNAVIDNNEIMGRSLTDMYDEATDAVPGLGEALTEGTVTIEEALAALPAAMTQAGLDLEDAAEMIDASDEMGAVGENAVAGLVTALENNTWRVRGAARNLGDAIAIATAAALDTGSPSRVMMELGEFAVEGLIVGIQSMSDESYAAGVQAALILATGIEDLFRDTDDPQEEARDFATDVADTIIEELIAEQENVADAAEALAEAAADRLAEAWDRVVDRFRGRDIKDAVAEAQADLAEAQAELAAAASLAGADGSRALKAAEARIANAEDALELAKAADTKADLLADQTLTAFQRGTEDAVEVLQAQQDAEVDSIQARIDAATRNLDPVVRAAAEAELAAALERHEAEMTALDRRREDEETALRLRLDNENTIREEAIKAKQDELTLFSKALDDVVKSIAGAIEDLPGLRADITDSQRDVQDAFFDQFENMLQSGSLYTGDIDLLRSIGLQAGLSDTEANDLINATFAASSATAGATAAALGMEHLLDMLSSGEISFADIINPSVLSGLLDNVNSGTSVPTSQLVDTDTAASSYLSGALTGPLITMPGAVIQDATDADLVAQQLIVALSAAGVS